MQGVGFDAQRFGATTPPPTLGGEAPAPHTYMRRLQMTSIIANDFIGIDVPNGSVHFYAPAAGDPILSPGEAREYYDRDRYRLTPTVDADGRVTQMVRTTS